MLGVKLFASKKLPLRGWVPAAGVGRGVKPQTLEGGSGGGGGEGGSRGGGTPRPPTMYGRSNTSLAVTRRSHSGIPHSASRVNAAKP